ncbi:MAG TPA: NTP transferase domain-containing protein, partial [Rhodocyclaceae bacterium]|nr:NTP transferase domain-containing protein [Rhodocyclaceae bacterium]
MSQPAALILAAGYSSRMGAFKPLLTLGDRSAITWCVSAFRDAGISDIRVVTGFGAPELEPELHRLGVVGVPNPNYDRGMFSSIQAGIASLADDIDACFLLPVDTPLVRASTVAALAARRAAAPAPVVNPSFRGQRGHPPVIDKALFAEILAGDGEGGLRALLQRHEAVAVDVVDEAILLDMDTPEDFARLDERAQHRDVPSEAECEAIFERDSVAEPVRRHSRAVASVAAALAQHLDDIDQQVVNAAALLHDIAKGRPDHAEAGATRVASLGYPAVAEAMRHHMDFNFGGRLDAAAVVFVADKLV